MILMGKLTTLNREISQYLTGGYPYNDFQKAWNNLAIQFRRAIADSRPVVVITDPEVPKRTPQHVGPDTPRGSPSSPTPAQMHSHAIVLTDSEGEIQCKPALTLVAGKKRGHGAVNGTPRKQPRLIDLPPFVTTKGATFLQQFTSMTNRFP